MNADQFIQLNNEKGNPVLVNFANVIWIEPKKEGSLLYFNVTGRLNYAIPLVVKESMQEIEGKMHRP